MYIWDISTDYTKSRDFEEDILEILEESHGFTTCLVTNTNAIVEHKRSDMLPILKHVIKNNLDNQKGRGKISHSSPRQISVWHIDMSDRKVWRKIR